MNKQGREESRRKYLQKQFIYDIIVKYKSKLRGDNKYGSAYSNIYTHTYNICTCCVCSYSDKNVWNEGKRFLGLYRSKSDVR